MDTADAAERINRMWMELGEKIANAVPQMVEGFEPENAIRWATCDEACFWKATGESDSHDVKDVLRPADAATPQ